MVEQTQGTHQETPIFLPFPNRDGRAEIEYARKLDNIALLTNLKSLDSHRKMFPGAPEEDFTKPTRR